jgi:hypothetical protein
MGRRNAIDLRIQHKPEVLLQGDYLPTRTATVQVLCTERAERARLEVRPDDRSYAVTNELGTDLRDLLLRDARGDYFRAPDGVRRGEKTTLVPVDAQLGGLAARNLLTETIRGYACGVPPEPQDALVPGATWRSSRRARSAIPAACAT